MKFIKVSDQRPKHSYLPPGFSKLFYMSWHLERHALVCKGQQCP